MSARGPVLCLAVGLAATAPAAAQAVPDASDGGSAQDTLEYWTVERMQSAVPLPQEAPTGRMDGESGAALQGKSSRAAAAPPVIIPESDTE